MRARIKFTTTILKESLIGVLKENRWGPHFDQTSPKGIEIIKDVRGSLEETDEALFDESERILISHTGSESVGTLSLEQNVWVIRLLNKNIHALRLACETLVNNIVEYAGRNHQTIFFDGPVQIVERRSKQNVIEGQILATKAGQLEYARNHRGVEFTIGWAGALVLGALLFATYPWPFRDFNSHTQTWGFSVLEKLIGSVAVTALLAYFQYRSFLRSLHEATIRWSIPGAPEKHDIKARAA
jgi:hypothetical protein